MFCYPVCTKIPEINREAAFNKESENTTIDVLSGNKLYSLKKGIKK